MSYTYSTFVTALATELAVSPTDVDFVAMLPTFINASENRCYRELDLLAATVTVTGTVSANSRTFTLPNTSGHILGVDYINIIDSLGNRRIVLPCSRDLIDWLWPANSAPSSSSIPVYFSRIDDTAVLFGPPPGSFYSAEIIGNIRPTPLSSSNTTTYLSQYLPDLFFNGAMVGATAFMRNFGAQADDPKMAVSWEGQFQTALASAKTEEMKKKYYQYMSDPASGTA
jgi:hypothetical protein